MISNELIAIIKREFALSWRGIHGATHWARVRNNGLKLAAQTGAKVEIVELFAFLHDVKRIHDGGDAHHGERAVEFARTLRGSVINLSDEDFELLAFACRDHSKGLIEADVTVQTCWDADRLDLGRVGISPKAKFLCTAAAKDPAMIQWAVKRGRYRPKRTRYQLKSSNYQAKSKRPWWRFW